MPLELVLVLGFVVWVGVAQICASLAVMAARGDRQLRGTLRPPRTGRRPRFLRARRGRTALR